MVAMINVDNAHLAEWPARKRIADEKRSLGARRVGVGARLKRQRRE